MLGQSDAKPEALAEALARELDRAQEDPAFAALALRLPDLNELLLAAAAPDPEALYAKRESLRRVIAQRLRPQLKAIALQRSETPFSPSAGAAARRSLKSAAIDLLAALGEEEAETLRAAFDDADNMTAAIAALEGLSASGAAAFDAALEQFYARWRDNPLVIDKCFAVQAATPRTDALKRAEALRTHPDFNIRNPNRVRALAAAFGMRNMRALHAADGSGYRFLAALARDVDALNPALAARLLTAFESWRRFDSSRQAHARAALQSLAALKDLSKNTSEVVERTLG